MHGVCVCVCLPSMNHMQVWFKARFPHVELTLPLSSMKFKLPKRLSINNSNNGSNNGKQEVQEALASAAYYSSALASRIQMLENAFKKS